MEKIYLCIDLKTFYASVECVERGLDPFQTDLVVADPTRYRGTICLAISPKMKARGIRNRCRIFEIPKNIKPIIAKPRMKKYIEYSAKIYGIYLKYIEKNDIHVYSIDEAFLDVTNYLKLYHQTPKQMAQMIMKDIYDQTGITATCGMGTNLYLAKIALDITAKHSKSHIGYLTEDKYKRDLWHHTPLTDFWQIGVGIENRLHKLHLKDMYDIAHIDEKKLYKEFGVNAKFLIDHSKGIEPVTISEIKKYKPKFKSISNHQILDRDYNDRDARKVLIEMVDNITLQLVEKNLCTSHISFYIGYSKDAISSLRVSKKLEQSTNQYSKILKVILEEYDYRIKENILIRRIGVSFHHIIEKRYEQLSLFSNNKVDQEEIKLEQTMNYLKDRFGKNSILRAISYTDGSTQRKRNQLIGGHNAE